MRKSVRSEVDFVLTFEEMAGIFAAKHVDLTTIEEDPDGVNDASTDGRSFAVGGGVAKAVVNVIQHRYPGREVKVTSSQGLRECRKMMQEAVAGKYPGYLLEGMACPGGCVAGAGTMQPIKKSQAAVGLTPGRPSTRPPTKPSTSRSWTSWWTEQSKTNPGTDAVPGFVYSLQARRLCTSRRSRV